MPKSVNSIDCQCGGHYVKKNRSKHMETNKHQSYIQNLDFIDWSDMDFGTARSSFCGICGKREPGYFSKGELQGDIICHDCDLVWEYDENSDRYGKRRNNEEEKNKIECLHCGKDTREDVACQHCDKDYNEERCDDKHCEICDHTCIHCNEKSEIDKETTECLNCGMYQDIECAE